jgi:hypothetical protein
MTNMMDKYAFDFKEYKNTYVSPKKNVILIH